MTNNMISCHRVLDSCRDTTYALFIRLGFGYCQLLLA